jgi:hypothetical protein
LERRRRSAAEELQGQIDCAGLHPVCMLTGVLLERNDELLQAGGLNTGWE